MGALCTSGEDEIQSEMHTGEDKFEFKRGESSITASEHKGQFYAKSNDHDLVKGEIKKHNSVSSKRAQKEYKNGMVEVVRF